MDNGKELLRNQLNFVSNLKSEYHTPAGSKFAVRNNQSSDGIVHGGHLLEMYVGPALEVIVIVEPTALYKKWIRDTMRV